VPGRSVRRQQRNRRLQNAIEADVPARCRRPRSSLPFTIVILRPFMRAASGEIEDAAVVDGASRLRFFWRIMLPLAWRPSRCSTRRIRVDRVVHLAQ
jgi:hypothetical protein